MRTQDRHHPSKRRFGWLCLSAALGSVFPVTACTESGRESQRSRSSAITGDDASTDRVIAIKSWSAGNAKADLASHAGFNATASSLGWLIETTQGKLATALNEAAYVETFLAFLQTDGVLLLPDGQAAPAEPIHLQVIGDPVRFQKANSSGAYVRLVQVVDGFLVSDGLVIGRFVGLDLESVTGTIFDPALSASRGQAMALPDANSARARFAELKLVSDSVTSTIPPSGHVRYRDHAVSWRYGYQQLDAISGNQMADLPMPTVD